MRALIHYRISRQKRKKLLFVFAAVLTFFLVVEGFLHLTGLDRFGADRFYRNIFDPLTLPIPGAKNPYVEVEEFMNNSGFRGADFERKKPRGVFRIICLGDSTTFGTTQYEDSYPLLLEQALNEGLKKKKIEVINAGIPGTNIYHQRMLFVKEFRGMDPDMVILMSGPNCRKDLKQYRDKMKSMTSRSLQSVLLVLSRFAVYRVLRYNLKGVSHRSVKDDFQLLAEDERLRTAVQTGETDRMENDPNRDYTADEILDDYREDLRIVGDIAKNWGFTLVILGSFEKQHIEKLQKAGLNPEDPDYLEDIFSHYLDRIAYEFAYTYDWPYIDATRDFVGLDQNEEGLWADPNHCGPKGNRILVNRVARELRERKLTPNL